MLAVEPAARRRADHGHAVRDGLLEGVELPAVLKDVRRVHGHARALAPVVLEVGRGEDEVVEAHVGHCAAGAADEFGLACLRALKGEEAARQIASDIVYRA